MLIRDGDGGGGGGRRGEEGDERVSGSTVPRIPPGGVPLPLPSD